MTELSLETTFRSFKLVLYRNRFGVTVHWWGPKVWHDQIKTGCRLWTDCPSDLTLEEFLDKLDIGRTTPKGTK